MLGELKSPLGGFQTEFTSIALENFNSEFSKFTDIALGFILANENLAFLPSME